jgi:hypothetical protein
MVLLHTCWLPRLLLLQLLRPAIWLLLPRCSRQGALLPMLLLLLLTRRLRCC